MKQRNEVTGDGSCRWAWLTFQSFWLERLQFRECFMWPMKSLYVLVQEAYQSQSIVPAFLN